MRKILTIAATNLRRTVRERVGVFFLFVFPMIMILVLGMAFGGASEPRVGVVGDRADPLAGALLDRLGAADGIAVHRVRVESDLVAAVERGELEAGLVIPARYGATIRSGGQVELRYVARAGQQANQVQQIVTGAVDQEASRLRAAQFALAERASAGFDDALGRVDALAAEVPAVAVTVNTAGTAAFPDALGRFDVGASSELLLFLFLTALTSSAALIETRRLGVSRRMLATPTTPATIVAGEAAGRLAVAILQGTLIMVGSALIFGVDWGNPVAATLLMVCFALVASGAGLLMGATARTPQQSLAFGLLLSLGLAALGGTMMPLDLFPSTMRAVAHLTPHAWAVDGFAELVRHDGGPVDILPQLGVLLAAAAALMALASWRLRRSISG
jgi:ABC-2 type transport system permease protein